MSRRGRNRELDVARRWRDDGWVVYRLAWGHADLAAFQAGRRPMLIQVKSTTQSPWEHFGRRGRTLLAAEARTAGADCVLAWWPPHRALRYFAPSEWPAIPEEEPAEPRRLTVVE